MILSVGSTDGIPNKVVDKQHFITLSRSNVLDATRDCPDFMILVAVILGEREKEAVAAAAAHCCVAACEGESSVAQSVTELECNHPA